MLKSGQIFRVSSKYTEHMAASHVKAIYLVHLSQSPASALPCLPVFPLGLPKNSMISGRKTTFGPVHCGRSPGVLNRQTAEARETSNLHVDSSLSASRRGQRVSGSSAPPTAPPGPGFPGPLRAESAELSPQLPARRHNCE